MPLGHTFGRGQLCEHAQLRVRRAQLCKAVHSALGNFRARWVARRDDQRAWRWRRSRAVALPSPGEQEPRERRSQLRGCSHVVQHIARDDASKGLCRWHGRCLSTTACDQSRIGHHQIKVRDACASGQPVELRVALRKVERGWLVVRQPDLFRSEGRASQPGGGGAAAKLEHPLPADVEATPARLAHPRR